jgi:hypothetical protein
MSCALIGAPWVAAAVAGWLAPVSVYRVPTAAAAAGQAPVPRRRFGLRTRIGYAWHTVSNVAGLQKKAAQAPCERRFGVASSGDLR